METYSTDEIQTVRSRIQECFENEERARSMMERTLMDQEILELKYKSLIKENAELKERLFVAEQIIKERKWAEWKENGDAI